MSFYGNPNQQGYPPQQPGYPPQQQPGYPPQQPGYPPQQPGNPPQQQPGYPAQQQPGYPPQQQPGYPPQQQPGYPPQQQPGYPPQHNPGQPPQQQGYPPQQSGNVPQQPGYPPQQQSGYPSQQGYPPQQQGYPPQPAANSQVPGNPYQQQQQPYAPSPNVAPVNPSAPTAYPPVVAPQYQPPVAPQYQPQVDHVDHSQGHSIQYAAAQSASLLAGNVGVGLPTAPDSWRRKGTNPKVQISLSAHKLADRDLTSKSDPLAVVFMYDVPTKKWYEAGRTESIRDNLNPEWATKIDADYFFEEEQKVRIEIYDKDTNSSKLKHHDFLGKAETKLSVLISSKGGSKVFPLQSYTTLHKLKSTVTIGIEQKSACRDVYSFRFGAKKLDDKDFFGKSDPYLEISREQGAGYSVVQR